MTKKSILSLFLLFIVSLLSGQNEKANRESFELNVLIDSVNYYTQEIPKSPYFVEKNILQIYPSEKIYVEVELKNDTIYSMKTVQKNLNQERTIIIEFNQEIKNSKSDRMMLKVKNPFGKFLNYKAQMFILGRNDWIPTSIIPVYPKISSFEIWNDIILSLVLMEWRLETK